MNITYEVVPNEQMEVCRDLCNELMAFQKAKARVRPELFDGMSFETRMVPSMNSATRNHLVVVRDDGRPVGYVYSNISPKEAYTNDFATFFDLSSVRGPQVGCLSQFYLQEAYRKQGIGSVLFDRSMEWLDQFPDIADYFIFVSNGNEEALKFYQRKGFTYSHDILDGFISVLRKSAVRGVIAP